MNDLLYAVVYSSVVMYGTYVPLVFSAIDYAINGNPFLSRKWIKHDPDDCESFDY